MNGAESTGRLKVIIDRPACCGYGLCAEICPEIFKLDAGGLVYVERELVPQGLEQQATAGAQACPQAALKVEPC